MQIGLTFKDGRYIVEIYTSLHGEPYPHWHTCRAFLHQGDAILFKELCELHQLDPTKFAMTFNPTRTCTHFEMHGGSPRLQMTNDNRTH